MTVMIQSVVQPLPPTRRKSSKRRRVCHAVAEVYETGMEDFAAAVVSQFQAPLKLTHLLDYSTRLQEECRQRLLKSDISMLPSYQHTLPTGHERGDVLALDVGGSTFRVALIRLTGRAQAGDGLQVRKLRSFQIDKVVRDLRGEAFFDWMAERIEETLVEHHRVNGSVTARLSMGVAWSFPVQQTSPHSGNLLSMGKGFRATHGVEGQDLSELIMRSCRKRGLNVEMEAIVNDGQATLLTQAYRDATTRIALILGTGTNSAVYFPVNALGPGKFGDRPDSWFATAKHVMVNTELSMVGKHVLPTTKWDEELNAKHVMPNFQPLEYLVAGRYLGEIVRLILVDAVHSAGLFGGHLPKGLDEPYTLDAAILAAFENDDTFTFDRGRTAFQTAYPSRSPSSPTMRMEELRFISDVAKLVSLRAAAYLATALHALWTLRSQSEGLEPGQATHVTVACDGTIVGKYPSFREHCQRYLDDLCVLSGAARGAVTLAMAPESSIFGAAVAVACMHEQGGIE